MMARLYLIVVFGSSLSSSAKKKVVIVGPPLTKLSGSAAIQLTPNLVLNYTYLLQ